MIEEIRFAKSKFKEIDQIIDENTLKDWYKVIDKYPTPIIYVESVVYNLLTVLYVSKYEQENKTGFEPYTHATQIIDTLNYYLSVFPNLTKDSSFLSKIRNLDGFNFLATMSELSVAHRFKSEGWNVTFEEKYKKLIGAKKDIDIKVSNTFDQVLFLEVYTPNEKAEIYGFFNPFEYNDKLKRKLKTKAFDKFSDISRGDLNGKRILVANTLYSGIFSMNLRLLNSEKFIDQLANLMPEEMNAMLLFEDDFSSSQSFFEIRTIIKN